MRRRQQNERRRGGSIVNRIWHAGTRVQRLVPDHELGGFVVVMDMDDPPKVEFLPVVGLVLYRTDDGESRDSAAGLYTIDSSGAVEFWDMGEAQGDEVLGVAQTCGIEVQESFTQQAAERLRRARERALEVEAMAAASFGGPVS